MAWIAIQPTINSIDPLSLSLSFSAHAHYRSNSHVAISVKLTSRPMKTIEGLRSAPLLEIFNSPLPARGDRRRLEPRPLMILHQFKADVSITPDEHTLTHGSRTATIHFHFTKIRFPLLLLLPCYADSFKTHESNGLTGCDRGKDSLLPIFSYQLILLLANKWDSKY